MSKTHLIQFYCITILIFSTSIICFEVSLCYQTPFAELCNLIIGPEFESPDSSIKVSASKTREALKHLLATSYNAFDVQAKTSLMDCLELYDDVINHLNLATSYMSAYGLKRWLSATIVNHYTCLKGFTYFNFSKLFEDMQVEHKLVTSKLASKLFTINHDGSVQVTEEGDAIKPNLVVAQDGSGHFSTITEAIEEAENQRSERKSLTNLMLIGDGIDATVITSDKNVRDNVLTYDTATVQVWGQGFVGVRITFENTAGPDKEQAIAVLSASDLSSFYQCSFKGYQDTLCLSENKQFLRELLGQENTITTQGRDSSTSTTGFVIQNSKIIRAPDSNPTGELVKTYLGRPWRDYSKVVYLKCDFGDVIDPEGWLPFMDNIAFDKLYYAEYMNAGESADTNGRMKWPGYHVLRTKEEAEQFLVDTFLSGESWLPETGVPFHS
ncbi:pectinesterase-like [Bidens hawaiensis]|uniref:pectinesterase-like n=1 Tax=Bidens hawaiensis TaxID=980011 RepID=UPI004049D6A6